MNSVKIVNARRILSADRRGSSWPVLSETDDGILFTKLHGAAQGAGPLIAEMVVATLAEAIGLRVPARTLVRFERGIESADRHGELRDLLDRSAGINLGFTYLDGARMFAPADAARVSTDDAASILWLDALVMNPDRTPHNPNMMWWRNQLWLIDHGAALPFQYAWSDVNEGAPLRPFAPSGVHVLRDRVADLDGWDELLAARLTRETIDAAVGQVPKDFLLEAGAEEPMLDRRRAAYAAYLWKRLKAPRAWIRSQAPA